VAPRASEPSFERRRSIVVAVLAVLGLMATVVVLSSLERAGGSRPASAEATVASTQATAQAPAPGAPTAAPQAASRPSDEQAWPDLALDLSWKLVLVLALAYGALAALRRVSVGPTAKRDGLLQVLDQAQLGPNRSIYVIKVMDKRLVVGATASQIVTLASWDLGGTLHDVGNPFAPLDDTISPPVLTPFPAFPRCKSS
jgi:flagellar biosynthetic protein FliO